MVCGLLQTVLLYKFVVGLCFDRISKARAHGSPH
jgi:hypothetical protein